MDAFGVLLSSQTPSKRRRSNQQVSSSGSHSQVLCNSLALLTWAPLLTAPCTHNPLCCDRAATATLARPSEATAAAPSSSLLDCPTKQQQQQQSQMHCSSSPSSPPGGSSACLPMSSGQWSQQAGTGPSKISLGHWRSTAMPPRSQHSSHSRRRPSTRPPCRAPVQAGLLLLLQETGQLWTPLLC